MKHKVWMRVFALLLLLALTVGIMPSVLASEESVADTAIEVVESAAEEESETSEEPQISPPEQAEETEEEAVVSESLAEESGDDELLSDDAESLTRATINLKARAATGTMGKSTCVSYFSAYQSPYWTCSNSSHSRHYFYASTIAYHTIDGELAFCIEPNVSSLSGQTYSSYDADSASSSSYWMLELDSTQRSYIEQILAFGYPEVDRGYSEQVQYAATQVLIWEVVAKLRYSSGIQYSSDYGLFSKVYAVLGADFQACYDGILEDISISDGTVPSFAGASSSAAQTVELTLNTSTNCYEGSVTDSNGVLSHFTFAYNGVTFTKSGNTLNISVPAASADAVKEQTITGTSDQKNMSTSNPSIWENSTYQTVLTAGGADNVTAYIKLTWEDAPQTGNLVVYKAVNYGSWEGFTFRLYGTSDKGSAINLTATTDSDGKAYFNDVEIGTYTLEEVDPGQQYILPEAMTVTITGDETVSVTRDNVWKHWYAKVTKVDADTGTAQGNASLDGAEYTLYKSGEAIATYTVKNGTFVTDTLPCTSDDGVYTLKETKAPTGYLLDETVYKLTTSYSHYSEAENSFTVTVPDTVIQGKIQLEKWAVNTVSGEQQAETGATFEVYLKSAGSYAKAKDSEKDIITIGEDGTGTSKDLPYGTYCVQQVSGWDGYELDETVYEVTISEDGQTVTKDTSGNALVVYNDIWTGILTIIKVDGDSNEPLSGAEFTLTGSDDSEVVVVTDSEGKAVFENLVYGVEYTWTETAAPQGYLLNEENTGTISVEESGAELEVTCENERRPGSITVTKENSGGDALFGCTLLLEYLDGDTWKPVFQSDELTPGGCSSENLENGCLTTDESGTVTFDGLWADGELQYRLTEVAAPEGYELLSEPVFEGVLPVAYDASAVSAEPDEVIDGTAYFYNLPITVRDGHIYTLPQTGGSGFPFVGIGVIALFAGGLLLLNHKYPYILKNLKRSYFA